MNSRSVAIFATVVAVLVGVSIWFLYSEHAPHYAQEPAPAVPAPKSSQSEAPRPSTDKPVVRPAPETPPTAAKPAPAAPVLTEDDRKIDEALRMYPGGTDQDHTNTAQVLISLLPTLSSDGQVECAQHISNLLSDEEYKRIMHIWRNPSYNAEVLEVFGTDLMNREHKVMLPAMLDALKMPNHPYHEDAKTTLEVFLDEDYGTDITKWERAMQNYLKKEADEEAAAAAAKPAR